MRGLITPLSSDNPRVNGTKKTPQRGVRRLYRGVLRRGAAQHRVEQRAAYRGIDGTTTIHGLRSSFQGPQKYSWATLGAPSHGVEACCLDYRTVVRARPLPDPPTVDKRRQFPSSLPWLPVTSYRGLLDALPPPGGASNARHAQGLSSSDKPSPQVCQMTYRGATPLCRIGSGPIDR